MRGTDLLMLLLSSVGLEVEEENHVFPLRSRFDGEPVGATRVDSVGVGNEHLEIVRSYAIELHRAEGVLPFAIRDLLIPPLTAVTRMS